MFKLNTIVFTVIAQATQIVTGQVCHQAYLHTWLTTLRKNEYGSLRATKFRILVA